MSNNKWSPNSFFSAINEDKNRDELVNGFLDQIRRDLIEKTKSRTFMVGAVIAQRDEMVVKQLGSNNIWIVYPNEKTHKIEFELASDNLNLYNEILIEEICAIDGATGPQTMI